MIHTLAAILFSSTPLPDVFVDVNAASCSVGDGSAAAPVCSITDAIGLAVAGDTIRIAPGTYFENVSITFDLDLVGTSGADVTIVDGAGSGSVITIPSAVTVVIDGLTVTGGLADFGGGIRTDGTLVLRNSTISGNATTGLTGVANQAGAGIGTSSFELSADITIENSTIADSHAAASSFCGAGGIALGAGSLTISNSTIHGNTSQAPSGSSAGGIAASGATINIRESTISENVGSFYGGGIAGFTVTLTISNSTIRDNTAPFGAGMDLYFTTLVVRNSTISGNTGTNLGGGIRSYDLTAGSLISGSTVTENSSNNSSPAIRIGGMNSAPLSIRNSIVAENFDTSSSGSDEMTGPLQSLGNNLIGTDVLGFTNGVLGDQVGSAASPIDPMLGPLQFNGGLTRTRAPLPGSPVIDKGSNTTFEPFDQRGIARPQGLRPDIGAFETEGNTISLCNGDGGNGMGCTECPCGNNAAPGTIGGCLNSLGLPARLEQIGSTSISLPQGITSDLRFSLVGALRLTFGILISSESVAPNNPANPCFGLQSGIVSGSSDGLACVAGSFQRHGTRRAHTNGTIGLSTLPWGGEAGPSMGIAQTPLLFAAGETRFFQVLYRDEDFGACANRMNSSQAIEVSFTP